jgi:hypothetical protein
MAWIAVVPPSPRQPHERYQESTRQRSAGVFPTKRRAEAERRAIDRGRPELAGATGIELEQKARPLFGDYVATKWWPAWKDQHPTSEYGTRKMVEKRILPTFGNIPLGDLDASTIGAWKSAMLAAGCWPAPMTSGCTGYLCGPPMRPATRLAWIPSGRSSLACSTPTSTWSTTSSTPRPSRSTPRFGPRADHDQPLHTHRAPAPRRTDHAVIAAESAPATRPRSATGVSKLSTVMDDAILRVGDHAAERLVEAPRWLHGRPGLSSWAG